MPHQHTPHSVGCWCGTQLMNTALLASCRCSVVLKGTPIGKIVALGGGSAADKILLDDLWYETGFKIHTQMEQ
jgi:hypothetical protein